MQGRLGNAGRLIYVLANAPVAISNRQSELLSSPTSLVARRACLIKGRMLDDRVYTGHYVRDV